VTVFKEFPLGLAGHIYGSPMPFGLYDRAGHLFREIKRCDISVIVFLAEDHECIEKSDRDLKSLYVRERLFVIHLPVPNYGVPQSATLALAVSQTIEQATNGKNILIHCSAGLGRTPFFATLLVRRVKGFTGREAMAWMSQYQPDALLSPAQILMILDAPP
jgi:hypothetical protein